MSMLDNNQNNKRSIPSHKPNRQTPEMWAIRKKMEEQFASHGDLHDPVMIQLSTQLDRLVVEEMRKHRTVLRTNRDLPPPQR
ncbi:Spo0E family sporulation regulatory protein-aspartic acid phosphatase [Sulfoacidibacillus ferrooxidans]|uniref:Spo0E like sporulation regulatory protein n=1 Tax=Sulfoacidibacillus ferrooxidans TaxID=2005001 RepID=A0A9X2ACZ2_9BACL|nr:Spo0E family sporulation regulatory protein-aspartic acid phosphatase [Sulfoacidibacillus ferrooxidans]MCI0181991.1 hypothetical protein [Sulfoacidibacillus ferrooxidans]